MYFKKIYNIIFGLFLTPVFVTAQVNLQIGYSAQYSNWDQVNQQLRVFNEQHPTLEKPFSSVHLFHGIDLGLRLKMDRIAVALSWQSSAQSKEAIAVSASDDVDVTEYFFNNNNYSLALENHWNNFGYGASLGRMRLKIKRNIGTSETKRELLSESSLSSQFYLIFPIQQSQSVSFVIKPYLMVPWEEFNISAFADDIDPSSTLSKTERPLIFGLSFVFYNGRQ